ncbi:MAG TPA: PTS sugar transporter subunit IIA [Gemmatimonadales bacterium]|jgi:mannitol/fructose-specific phosphotransferase system IIA component (Ntr-type)|nr:PTS sugar transporter subunit IIA [Gemmatimonadales bacterium]
MALREYFRPGSVNLNLEGASADETLSELVGLLQLDPAEGESIYRIVKRREDLGSTGVGRGIAIPHGRCTGVDHLRMAFGRRPGGVEFRAIDGKPVTTFFLIVAPPVETSNLYLPVLGKVAQFIKEPDVPDRLLQIQSPEEFFALLEEKGV